MLIVQACEFNDTGDGVYRFHAPSRALSRLPDVCVVDSDLQHRLFPQLAEQADVLILAGFDSDMVPLLEQRRAAGRITVFEANDYYDDIQSWNPLAARWYDRALQCSFRQGLTLTDAIQTSTPELARRWRLRTSHPVAAFPNQLAEVPPLKPVPVRPLTIGWGGSPGHFADWYHLAPRLQAWLEAHPDVHLAVMNSEFARDFLRLRPERYHYRPFGNLAEYLDFLRGVDIGLAPLLPSDYNRCRSDVKFLEYASSGVAGIYADLEPYRDTVVDGETGLLYGTQDELFAALDKLAGDAALRQRIRQQSYEHVAQHRRLEQHIQARLDFYQEVMAIHRSSAKLDDWSARQRDLPEGVLEAATCDGRYLQLRPQAPEQTLAAARKESPTQETVRSLVQLVEQHPQYVAALQALGQQLNNLRDHRRALDYLERARKCQPNSARTLAEVARAHYRLGDDQKARSLLEETLTRNPHCLGAWQYLLRLLLVMRMPDGSRWAAQAREHFPEHYELSLLGARVYPPLEAVSLLRQLVEQHAPRLAAEEVPTAAAAFSEAIREVAGPLGGAVEALELLTTACRAFPNSARLANTYGLALQAAGRQQDSYRELMRALALRRSAQIYRSEYPKEDGIFYLGQFAENVDAWRAEEG